MDRQAVHGAGSVGMHSEVVRHGLCGLRHCALRHPHPARLHQSVVSYWEGDESEGGREGGREGGWGRWIG